MNNKNESNLEDIVALRLMEEISQSESVTQRSLSDKLDVALGLVNTYIKHLVKKGYIRVKHFPRARYKYLMTPEGIAEKTRLVYKHLSYYNNLFKSVRHDCLVLFKKLEAEGVRTIAFCGVDEVAEIAYLSLQETAIKLTGVYDNGEAGNLCVGHQILPLDTIAGLSCDRVFIASIKKRDEILSAMKMAAVASEKIVVLGRERI